MSKIIPGAEPFFFSGGDVGCLLLHGLTGTPFEMRELGEHLSAQGYTVSGPRLAGHGTTDWRDLANTKWQDWYQTVAVAYSDLAVRCRQVCLVGLSAGGALALYHCANYGGIVPPVGCVAMAVPAFYHTPLQMLLIRLASWVMPYKKKGESRINDPEARRTQITGLHQPLKSGVMFYGLLRYVRASLPKVEQRILLIYSKIDPTVPFSNSAYIFDRLGTKYKQLLTLERSYHILTRDYDKHVVFQAVESFLVNQK
jgi:carboxylesterase